MTSLSDFLIILFISFTELITVSDYLLSLGWIASLLTCLTFPNPLPQYKLRGGRTSPVMVVIPGERICHIVEPQIFFSLKYKHDIKRIKVKQCKKLNSQKFLSHFFPPVPLFRSKYCFWFCFLPEIVYACIIIYVFVTPTFFSINGRVLYSVLHLAVFHTTAWNSLRDHSLSWSIDR